MTSIWSSKRRIVLVCSAQLGSDLDPGMFGELPEQLVRAVEFVVHRRVGVGGVGGLAELLGEVGDPDRFGVCDQDVDLAAGVGFGGLDVDDAGGGDDVGEDGVEQVDVAAGVVERRPPVRGADVAG